MAELRYWDSACFLAWLRDEEGRADKCEAVFSLCERGKAEIVTSVFASTEVLMMGAEVKLPSERRERVRALFRRPYIKTVMLDRRIAHAAQDVVWDHGVHPRDAIHVATAIDAKAEVLNTFDDGLVKKSGQIGIPPLAISYPFVNEPELSLAGRHPEVPA